MWSISDDGIEVIRHHHSPRKALFNPLDTKDIPVDPANLKPNRKPLVKNPIETSLRMTSSGLMMRMMRLVKLLMSWLDRTK